MQSCYEYRRTAVSQAFVEYYAKHIINDVEQLLSISIRYYLIFIYVVHYTLRFLFLFHGLQIHRKLVLVTPLKMALVKEGPGKKQINPVDLTTIIFLSLRHCGSGNLSTKP